ncbi:hypothetical protein [uncultured Clostridium sp.]|uniref:hypothetical protein n=1 Tax=Catenibacterium sp. TaxID=2049022 RepID=UPI0025F7B692|nr:hypothetical protein [uncultured Clostridium sp.]
MNEVISASSPDLPISPIPAPTAAPIGPATWKPVAAPLAMSLTDCAAACPPVVALDF